jgi:hypothetical protein
MSIFNVLLLIIETWQAILYDKLRPLASRSDYNIRLYMNAATLIVI